MKIRMLVFMAMTVAFLSCTQKYTDMNRLNIPEKTKIIYLSRKPIPDVFHERVDNADEVVEILKDKKQIAKIDHLDNVPDLTYLYIASNRIETIENLDRIPKLLHLDLSYNPIAKITGLDDLHSLRMLDLSSCAIVKIENLDELTNLQYLNISSNRIAKLENLENLKNLKTLYLNGNPLTVMSLKVSNYLANTDITIYYTGTEMTDINHLLGQGIKVLPE